MSDKVFDGLGEEETSSAPEVQDEANETGTENEPEQGSEEEAMDAAPEKVARPRPTASKRGAKSKGKTAKTEAAEKDHVIRLHDSSEFPPGGLTVGINGKFYRLRPDVDMQVPESVLEVLDHAVRTEAKLNSDNQVIGQRNVPRFPYTMVRGR